MKNYLFVLFLSIILGCRPDTGLLIPTKVTDISQIRVQAYLFKSYKQDKEYQQVRVRIRDANDLLKAIDGGAVYFHKWKLAFSNNLFDTPQYKLTAYNKKLFYPDSTYKLTIMLSDSSKYYFYIHTPERDLTKFVAPAKIDSGQNIKITWQEVCSTNPGRVKVEIEYFNGNYTKMKKVFLPISNPSRGYFIIPWSIFAAYKKVVGANLELYYETEGSLDPRLLDNSYLRAQYKMKCSVVIAN